MSLTVYRELEQGSDTWLRARAGILTASTIGQLITAKTIKPAQNDYARGLHATLIAERITGHVEPVIPNRAMTRGTLLEDEARRLYTERTGNEVEQIGFARLDTDTYTLGASPDGLIGDDGGLEIKCPAPKTHINTVISGEIPPYNRAQVQASMHVTGRDYWDFVSYLPGQALYIIRDYPERRWQDAIAAAAEAFEATALEQIGRYRRNTYGLPETPYWNPFAEEDEITFGTED